MNEVEKVPSIGISFTAELPGKKALVLQSFIDRDCKPEELDGILDKVRVAADRQFSFGMIEILKLELEQQEKIANDHANRIDDLTGASRKIGAGTAGKATPSCRSASANSRFKPLRSRRSASAASPR